jgi:VWFA-related protein
MRRRLHRVSIWRVFSAAAMSLVPTVSLALTQEQPPPRYTERVDVPRVLIDARVVDRVGEPVLGLGTGDFQVKIDGRSVRVESVVWMAGALAGVDRPLVADDTRMKESPAPGRLIVFFIQKSLEPGRVLGLLRGLLEARAFLDTFTPHDRVAVVSFDTHLKLWLDFTNDLWRVRQVFQRDILRGRPAAIESAPPSLVARLAASEARRIYSVEAGLAAVAEALHPLPGAKAIVVIGYGFGRVSFGRGLASSIVTMENDYEAARRALQAARASVFSLDITDADYHSLEAGLQIVSDDTGGFFERTHIFPASAFRRLAGALAGHYVLVVEKPELPPGVHRISVALTGRNGTVLSKRAFEN